MSAFKEQLQRVIADRRGPEARQLFGELLDYVQRRVAHTARTRCQGNFTRSELEEVSADVMVNLMSGGLVRFQGETPGELYAYVRTAADRTVLRMAERRVRERAHVESERVLRPAHGPAEPAVEFAPTSPLPMEDQVYLRDLIAAGSKAALARTRGVSRAAVTQRIQRIRKRIGDLGPVESAAHEVWMSREARRHLESISA